MTAEDDADALGRTPAVLPGATARIDGIEVGEPSTAFVRAASLIFLDWGAAMAAVSRGHFRTACLFMGRARANTETLLFMVGE